MHLFLLLVGLVLASSVSLGCCWLCWQLLQQNGRLLLRLDELEKRLNELEFAEGESPESLPVGSEAPAFELQDLAGERKSLAQYRGEPVLLIFFNPACGFCRDMMPRLAALHKIEGDLERVSSITNNGSSGARPQILIISTGSEETNRQSFVDHKVTHPILLQREMEVAAAYKANGTPTGYLIGPDGKIASELAMGAQALLGLFNEKSEIRNRKSEIDQNLPTSAATSRFGNRSLAKSKIKRDGLKAGAVAPEFRLPRLDGRGDLSLNELRGKPVLLVFSSPSCGPCNTLAPELEKFHRAHSEIELVMISKGEPKENRAKVREYVLTFPIVLQQQWEISRRFAMFATPVAYLIDENGVIDNDVAVGTDRILALMSSASNGAARPIEAGSALDLASQT